MCGGWRVAVCVPDDCPRGGGLVPRQGVCIVRRQRSVPAVRGRKSLHLLGERGLPVARWSSDVDFCRELPHDGVRNGGRGEAVHALPLILVVDAHAMGCGADCCGWVGGGEDGDAPACVEVPLFLPVHGVAGELDNLAWWAPVVR